MTSDSAEKYQLKFNPTATAVLALRICHHGLKLIEQPSHAYYMYNSSINDNWALRAVL